MTAYPQSSIHFDDGSTRQIPFVRIISYWAIDG